MSQNAIHTVLFKTNVVSAKHIKQRDDARVKHLVAGHQPHGPLEAHRRKKCHSETGSAPDPSTAAPNPATVIPCTNAGVTYLASVGFGNPPTNCNLLIDTGSSNTWVKKECYKTTSTSQDMRQTFKIGYGSGSCSGGMYQDQVTLGPELVIKNQPIGVADRTASMTDMDGILGIGPVDLTQGTTPGNAPVSTVTDNCKEQGLISNEIIGVCYKPTTGPNAADGWLSFGGPDSSKYTGDITYVPITETSPARNYWGIDQSIYYNDQELMATCAGISDTGTTLTMLPSGAFQAYQQATGATPDSATGLLCVTEDQYNNMESMFFNIGAMKCELTKNAQIWPRSMNSTLGGSEDKIYLIFADIGDVGTGGLCFINGYSFLQRFYSVYDTTNSRVGYATTENTMATTN
ncbi:acid protease [Mycena vitilis]|nr:acid protease [Mycena vitilis]KAJ6504594.1 acid protease [Mycena vitilis]